MDLSLAPLRLLAVAVLLAVTVFLGACAGEVVTSTSAPPVSATTISVITATSVPPATTPSQPEQTTTTSGAPQVIKIGALFPLTGDLAPEGESALKGMRLAIEEINAAGGIPSLGGAPLTLVQADSQGEANTAVSEVVRLSQEEGVVAIVGTGQSTVALEATEASERLELPFVVSSAAADEVTERDLRYTFRLCPKADWYARDQVAFLRALKDIAGLEVTKVALLHEDDEYGKQTSESQKAYLAQAGIEVVADFEYSPEHADVHTEIYAIKQSGAQALLTATFLGDAAVIAQDAAVLRLKMPIVDAAGGVLDPNFISDAGEGAELMMSVTEYGPGSTQTASLETSLGAGGAVLDADMLYGYQAVWVLASALQRGGSAEGPELRGALGTTALYGEHLVLPQGLLTFDGDGQNRGAGMLVVQVQGGRLVSVWPREYATGDVLLP